MRRGAKPAKAKVEAQHPAARRSPKNESSRGSDLEKRLAEALKREAERQEQQAATAEILRVISSAPTDLQPVLDAVAASAARFCAAYDAVILRLDGDVLHSVAHHGPISYIPGLVVPAIRGTVAGRSVLDRQTVQVADLQAEAEEFPESSTLGRELGHRTLLSVPLLREGVPIGAIVLRRTEVQAFTEEQIALLKTFADQAVIAIENVRLFTELQASNRELTEALEQQTATSEILRVISRSPTDVQPVFDTVIESAVRLCDGARGNVYTFDGELLHHAAECNATPESAEFTKATFPKRPGRDQAVGRVILDRDVVHIPDVEQDPEFSQALARARGFRSAIAVPLLREGSPIGVIAVTRAEPGPFSDNQIALLKTFADQAVIAIENVRLFTELQEKNRALTQAHAQVTETLEQQTATSEILRVISSSPTDIQPVFDTIVKSVARLCDGVFAALHRFDGELLHWVAQHNYTAEGLEAMRETYPMRADRDTASGRAVIDRTVIHIRDFEGDPDVPPRSRAIARAFGYRSLVTVPMLREGQPVGAIAVARRDGPFSAGQITLLQTFADQAVIAIENVRLFNETKEALDQQTATSDILGVISSSPTDIQPVFEAMVQSARRLCDAFDATIFQADGDALRLVAHEGPIPAYPVGQGPSISGETLLGRAVLDRRTIHVADLQAEIDEYPEGSANARLFGHRTALVVPLLRSGEAIGAIAVRRTKVRPFSEKQIALLQTFADQAVIAIENVRLFTELQEKNQALTQAHAQVTESLEQQTATSEILRVISRSPTDVQPVFEAIVRSAVGLCKGFFGAVFRYEAGVVDLVAECNVPQQGLEALRRIYPGPPAPGTAPGRALLTREVVHIHDQANNEEFTATVARASGFRTNVAVPMLRNGQPIGAIAVARGEVQPFSETEIQLLKTFADQAVIAIENVRLFRDLQDKNAALTQAHTQVSEALEQQTATSEILRVISRSPTDLKAVFDAIVQSAGRLCEAEFGALQLFDGNYLTLDAHYGISAEDVATLQQQIFPLRPDRSTSIGRAIVTRNVVHIADIRSDPEFRAILQAREGYRTVLSAPMLRGDAAVGVLNLWRREVRPFARAQIDLVKTFADQAVIAIENVRLFKELEARNRELTEALERQTATSEVLKTISRSTFDLQPVLQTLIESATRLSNAQQGFLFTSDGELHHLAVEYNAPPAFREWAHRTPIRTGDGSVVGRVALEGRIVQIFDAQADADWCAKNAEAPGIGEVRTLLGVPMRREGVLIGVIAMWRTTVRPFIDKELEMVETFADQAVIAVENTRLLGELRARTGELTRSVQELTALGDVSRALSSTLDLEVILHTIVTRANQLAGTDACSVFEYDEATEAFHLRATNNLDEEVVALARRTPTRKGEGVQGRMAVTRQPVQVPDIAQADAYRGPLRDILLRTGTRAVLAIPMLREDQLIGGLTVNKKMPGEFTPEVIELLKTFATQSALAIQNARLFREIADKSRQLEAASQHKSEFLANMSHELRTPLNAIIGFSEVLAEGMFGEVNEKQTEYLRDILESGQHLLSLINDILDLSKIEAGRMELELTDFDLRQAISNALTLVRERAARRSIALHQVVDKRLGQIRGDERKIKQVLLNLLSNALKFTPEGGRVDVRAGIVDSMAEISVTDTGVGIAPEDQEAVFEEFRQVGTAAKKVEGTGLGLALSRKFIELHGGRIWVKSQVGAGSTFTFTIPRAVRQLG